MYLSCNIVIFEYRRIKSPRNEKSSKAEKVKNRKIKQNKIIDFCLNPYVKNGIF